MNNSSLVDQSSVISGIATAGESARVQVGDSNLPKIPLTGGKSKRRRRGSRSRRSRTYKRKGGNAEIMNHGGSNKLTGGRRKKRKTSRK